MLGAEPRKRIAVVLPSNRAWVWHERIISVLRRCFDVEVYLSNDAPSYPRSLALWLRLETYLIGEFDLVKFERPQAAPWRYRKGVVYALILNLSEGPISCSEVPVVEVHYQGRVDSINLFAALIARQNPYLSFHLNGDDKPIVASYLAIPDRVVLARGLRNSFARLILLAERATEHVIQGTHSAILPRSTNSSPAFSMMAMSLFCVYFTIDKTLFRVIRRLQIQEYWSIALLQAGDFDVTRELSTRKELIILPDDGLRYYADPFLFADAGRRWLFFEELEYRSGKGIISCAEIKDEKQICTPRPVLERPYHLSYPFIFRHGEEIYMIPESGDNNRVELYRAQSFPLRWELHLILLENVALYDATLLQYQGRWWLFGAISYNGSPPLDELAIFYSESLEGAWHPHSLNPVKSDCRSARPAGRVLLRNNRLLRPAQDCEYGYGDALVWCEIKELTPDRFDEREVGRWSGNQLVNADGLHTFDHDDALGVIDIRRTIWKRSVFKRKSGYQPM
jgi:hypothetical protein